MDELRVPTRRMTVEIDFGNGSTDRGSFFLADLPYAGQPARELAEFLNDEREFVPFASRDSHSVQWLIAKRHLLRVRAEKMDAEGLSIPGLEPTAHQAPSVVTFDDQSQLSGRAIHEVPLSCSRLVDKLNRAPTFLAFLTSDGLEFLHMAHIVRIASEE